MSVDVGGAEFLQNQLLKRTPDEIRRNRSSREYWRGYRLHRLRDMILTVYEHESAAGARTRDRRSACPETERSLRYGRRPTLERSRCNPAGGFAYRKGAGPIELLVKTDDEERRAELLQAAASIRRRPATPPPAASIVVSRARLPRNRSDLRQLAFPDGCQRPREKERWYENEFDRSAWAKASVPKAWDLFDNAVWGYEGIGWYATSLPGALDRKDKVQRLKFGHRQLPFPGLAERTTAGENVNGYLPFEF